MTHPGSRTVAGWAAWLLWLGASGCTGGYSREDCDPGYLKVDGICSLAVGQDCQGGGDCLSGICVVPESDTGFCTIHCLTHDDCPGGFYCPPEVDVCTPGQRPPPCQTDADCAACSRCQEGLCVGLPSCVTCTSDGDCPACWRCVAAECASVAGCQSCAVDADCAPCETCMAPGTCQHRAGCLRCSADLDCPGCTACVGEACTTIPGCGLDPCFNDLDCPAKTRCLRDGALGYSVCLPTELPFGSDCGRGGDAACAEGVCVGNPDGSFTCSRPCVTDEDCPASRACRPDQACLWACRVPESPVPGATCSSNWDCPADTVCALLADPGGDRWEPRCLPPQVCAASPGEACVDWDGRCTTGACTAGGVCTPICTADADCPTGFLCDLLELPLPPDGPWASFRGCSPAAQVLGDIGEPCPRGDTDCKSGLCLAGALGGPHPFCSLACTPGGFDCPDRFECIADPDGSGTWLCQPAVLLGDCIRDEECPVDQVCTQSGTGAGTMCVDPTPGGVLPGEACSLEILCANRLCLPQGVCGAVCEGVTDCPAGFICDYVEIFLDTGDRAFAKLCVPDPGSMLPCSRSADCPSEEVCGVVLNPWGTGLSGRCQPIRGTGEAGDACALGPDCQAGFCPVTGVCSSLCLDVADCPSDFACTWIQISLWDGATFPATGCVSTARGTLGEPCPGGATDCLSAVCYHPQSGDPYCSKECLADPDCLEVQGMTCPDDGSTPRYCQFP